MRNKPQVDWRIIITGIIAITILEGIALIKGINGILLTSTIGILAGIVGWAVPQLRTRK